MRKTWLVIVCAALAVVGVAAWINKAGLPLVPAWRADNLDTWIAGVSLTVLAVIILAWTFARPARHDVVQRPRPDLPIRDLFAELEPGLVTAEAGKISAVGQRLVDRLRSGAVRAWARDVGRSGPLRPVSADYWRDAELTFWFLPPDADPRSTIHATRADGTGQVRDIHFYRAEATTKIALPD